MKCFFGESLLVLEEWIKCGIGFGVIISVDGCLIINVYVVKGVDIVKVILKDGWVFEGVVKGVDLLIDIVIIKIEVMKLLEVFMGKLE